MKKKNKLENIQVTIKKGKNTSKKEVKKLMKLWKEAFGGAMNIVPEEFIIIVYDSKGKILSSGRLIPIKLTFLGKRYNILGIGEINSVIKRKGYGKVLMHAIIKHLKNKKLTGVGFCNLVHTKFYKKCGLKVSINATEQFLYKNPKGELIKDKGNHHVIYLNGKNNFMKRVLSNKKEKILIPCPHW